MDNKERIEEMREIQKAVAAEMIFQNANKEEETEIDIEVFKAGVDAYCAIGDQIDHISKIDIDEKKCENEKLRIEKEFAKPSKAHLAVEILGKVGLPLAFGVWGEITKNRAINMNHNDLMSILNKDATDIITNSKTFTKWNMFKVPFF